jgi:hypothetical protein
MPCFFCHETVEVIRSSFDELNETPDLHEAHCKSFDCGLRYHFEGSLLATRPDLSNSLEIRERVKRLNATGVAAVLLLFNNHVVVRELPFKKD